jgi:RNA polymerase sigma factor (sigma-70 family)
MEPASGADGPSLAAADQIRLLGAIDALPRRQREVIVLRYYEDLSVAEVAELLAITRAAVSASASVAMVALRRALGDEHDRNA